MAPSYDKIELTYHAVGRFHQRFNYKLTDTSVAAVKNYIRRELATALCCRQWTGYSFQFATTSEKYGPTEVFRINDVFYICVVDNNKLVVKTVVHRFRDAPRHCKIVASVIYRILGIWRNW